MQLSDLVAHHRQAASTYHDHKEKAAYAITTLYITGMAVWLFNDRFWSASKTCADWWLLGLMALAALVLTCVYVCWQFRNRFTAALLEAACINVEAKIVAGDIDEKDEANKRYGPWDREPHLLLPAPILREINDIEKKQRQRVQTSESVTLVGIAVVALLLLLKILIVIR